MRSKALITRLKHLTVATVACFLVGYSGDRMPVYDYQSKFAFDGLSGHVVSHLYEYDGQLFAGTDQGLYTRSSAGQ